MPIGVYFRHVIELIWDVSSLNIFLKIDWPNTNPMINTAKYWTSLLHVHLLTTATNVAICALAYRTEVGLSIKDGREQMRCGGHIMHKHFEVLKMILNLQFLYSSIIFRCRVFLSMFEISLLFTQCPTSKFHNFVFLTIIIIFNNLFSL